MSTTVEVFAMACGDVFSSYFGIEDNGMLFLKKDSWSIGPEYCKIYTCLTKLAENSASIYRPDTIRKINFLDLEHSSFTLSADDPHYAEIEAYAKKRQEILDKLPTT